MRMSEKPACLIGTNKTDREQGPDAIGQAIKPLSRIVLRGVYMTGRAGSLLAVDK